MKNNAEESLLINCLNTYYGIAVTRLTFLPLGADREAATYQAETREGQSYFVKLKQGHHSDIGVALLGLLQASGVPSIIPPVKTRQGNLLQHIDDFTLIVYPFVEGKNGFSYPLKKNQWIALGKALKQVHELDLPLFIRDQIRIETYSSKWRDVMRSLDMHQDLVNDVPALKLKTFMQEHKTIIDRVVNRAESLSQVIQKKQSELVLCHSDIHAGNVLIDGKDAIYIVDWDEPIIAPKERDLMFIGGGVANVWNNPGEEQLFYQGYSKTDINRGLLAYYRHERIVQDIAEYSQALLLTSDGGETREEMYKHFTDMFERNGVVDIAFKTDEKLAFE